MCDRFMLTESSVERVILASQFRFAEPTSPGSPKIIVELPPTRIRATIEMGMMTNVSQRDAYGGSLFVGNAGPDARVGAKARYRRWLGSNGMAIDVGVGASVTEDQWTRATALNFLGDVAINAGDYGALTAGVTTRQAKGKHLPMLYGGARLGSAPGIVGAGILTLLATAVVFAVGAST